MEPHFNKTFFKALCENYNTTIPKVADELDMNPQTLRRLVNCEAKPSIETVAKLGEYFDVNLSLFIVLGEPLEVLTYEEQKAIKASTKTKAKADYRKYISKLEQAKKRYGILENEVKRKEREQFALKMFLLNAKEYLQERELVSQYLEAFDKELYDFIMSIEE